MASDGALFILGSNIGIDCGCVFYLKPRRNYFNNQKIIVFLVNQIGKPV